jgi:hypothetical protein
MQALGNNPDLNALCALNQLDLDTIRCRFEGEVTDEMRAYCDGGEYRVRKGETRLWQGQAGPDVRLWSGGEHVGFYGSPHKDTLGVGKGPFGRAEFSDWVEQFADRVGMPLPVVLNGRVSRLDVAANLNVSAAVTEYVNLADIPSRMERRQFSTTTVVMGNGIVDLALYDKVRQVVEKAGAHHVPGYWVGKNVLRAEMRLRRPDKDLRKVVIVGDLCEEEFWDSLADRYEKRFLSIPFHSGGAVGSPSEVRTMIRVYAANGILRLGGIGPAYARIDEGDHSRSQRNRLRKAVAETVEKHGGGSDLAEEFRGLIKIAAENH